MRPSWQAVNNSPLLTYMLAMVMGALFFAQAYPAPLEFIGGDSVYFEVGDAPQHVSSWLLFAKDAWRWPLLKTELLVPPSGTHIALTDSIPLAALVFKPLFPLFGENFHYFGLWHLLAAMFQGLAAVYLVRGLGEKRLWVGLAGAAMALLTPALLARLDHTALMTHGVILMALGLYFRATGDAWAIQKISLQFGLLSFASLLIHPYLFAMVFPIYLACACDRWGPGRDWRTALISLFLTTALVAAPAVLLGYAGASENQVTGLGRGHFSMNLLAPFCGGSVALCDYPDATGGQYEGINLLGLGALLILLSATALVLGARRLGVSRRSRWGLIVILIGFTLYALTTEVYLGADKILALPQPFIVEELTSIFRAAGRFFWPVGYVLVFVALAAVARHSRVALVILPLAIAAQWLDTDKLRADNIRQLNAQRPFDYSGWKHLAGDIEAIEIRPPYGCVPSDDTMQYLYFQLVAGRLGIPINTGYLARGTAECGDPVFEHQELPGHTLTVFMEPDILPVPRPETLQQRIDEGSCVEWKDWGGKLLCLDTASTDDWQRIGIR